ncbi:MAG: carbon storage regulator [Wolinella sp.]
MLILSRKEEESIVIGDEIVIKVVAIDKGSVKLGFEAPPHMLILREELKKAIADENIKASTDADDIALSSLGFKLKK